MELSATDLRIGNLVQSDKLMIPRMGIWSDGVMELSSYGIFELDEGNLNVERIPLTEDWLLKFGFEDNKINLDEYVLEVSCNGFSGTLTTDPKWFISIIGESSNSKVTQVKKYVHELQNIYHWWMEKELKIHEFA